MLIQVIIFGSIAVYLLAGLANWSATSMRVGRQTIYREQAIQIAEAGVDYYRWHLAHSPQDYQDGTGMPGPYVHDFKDKDGNSIGQFTLDITPPPLGSSLVAIKSSGGVATDIATVRNISVRLAKPSFAKFAVVANAAMRFGEGTEIFGPVHSNGGIRLDGLAHNVISSSATSYNDPDHSGGNEFGVHTHVNAPPGTGVNDNFRSLEAPPNSPSARSDVFEAGRQFPVPAVDFAGITADFAQMKSDAQVNGFYRPSAGALGYHVVLRADDTFDLYRTTGLVNAPSGCTNSQNQTGWGTWSISNQNLIGNYPLPANGIIFLEDDVFIDGQINTGHITIVAAFLPDNPPFRKNIIVNQDLLYTNYDGQDTIGLIAQGNINVGMVSDTDLRIDAALIAQNGRVGRYYYRPPGGSSRCSPYHTRQTITLWGMIGTNQRYGFAYTDGNGYQTRNINYDGNLLYAPPPSFPLASEQYMTLSWEETE